MSCPPIFDEVCDCVTPYYTLMTDERTTTLQSCSVAIRFLILHQCLCYSTLYGTVVCDPRVTVSFRVNDFNSSEERTDEFIEELSAWNGALPPCTVMSSVVSSAHYVSALGIGLQGLWYRRERSSCKDLFWEAAARTFSGKMTVSRTP